MTVRIYAVEDHELMRGMLVEFLSLVPGFEVSGFASSAEEALGDPSLSGTSIVLVDVSLPGMTGIDFVRELRGAGGGPPCVMLSGHRDPSYVRHALAAGAVGYVVKGNPEELVHAIRTVLGGGRYVSGEQDHFAVEA